MPPQCRERLTHPRPRLGPGVEVQGVSCYTLGAGFYFHRIVCFASGVPGGVCGLGFKVEGLRIRVYDLGHRFKGQGLRVKG
jgi:hypothetical protein